MLNGSWKRTNGSMLGKVTGGVLLLISVWLGLHSVFTIPIADLFICDSEGNLKYTPVSNLCKILTTVIKNSSFPQYLDHTYMHKK